jgi:hypothetical protein
MVSKILEMLLFIQLIEGLLPSEIIPDFLYLGSWANASNLQQLRALGITHILNVAGELDFSHPEVS